MKNILSILLMVFTVVIYAQETHSEARDLINKNGIKYMSQNSDDAKITHTQIGDTAVLRVETRNQPQFIYNLATRLPLNTEKFSEGQVFLLSFMAKTDESSEETGEAKVLVQLVQSDSFKDNLAKTLNLGSSWQPYYIPFKATKNISEKDLAVVMQYGFSPQAFSIKNVKFEAFPAGTALEALPKTAITYAGMEEDAIWRQAANARIERFRKGDFKLKFTVDGKPLAKQKVEVSLIRHAFPFGAMMHADNILDDPEMYDRFKDAFALTVLGNDLKIKRWSRPKNQKGTLNALSLLNQDGVTVKGHVLMWPGFQYNSAAVKKNKKNPEAVKQILRKHIKDILAETQGKVSHWDVVNETYTNKDFQNLMGGEDFLYEAFEITKKEAPQVRRFTNEYGIISKGGIDEQKQKWYYDYIKRVDEHVPGAVQGVGIQSHMGTDLTPPEKVLSILSFYATLGKPISISEFTMDLQEPKMREQYTRDFMWAAFSHPNVAEFMFWGFEEGDNKKVDIYKPDGSVGAMGKAYFSLVRDEWHTAFTEKTTKQGILENRGFYGLYVFKTTIDGKEKMGTFKVVPNMPEECEIKL